MSILKHIESLELLKSGNEREYNPGWTIDSIFGIEDTDIQQGTKTSENGYWP